MILCHEAENSTRGLLGSVKTNDKWHCASALYITKNRSGVGAPVWEILDQLLLQIQAHFCNNTKMKIMKTYSQSEDS